MSELNRKGPDRESQVVLLTGLLDAMQEKFGKGFTPLSYDLVAMEMYDRGARISSAVKPASMDGIVRDTVLEANEADPTDWELAVIGTVLQAMSGLDSLGQARVLTYIRSRMNASA